MTFPSSFLKPVDFFSYILATSIFGGEKRLLDHVFSPLHAMVKQGSVWLSFSSQGGISLNTTWGNAQVGHPVLKRKEKKKKEKYSHHAY